MGEMAGQGKKVVYELLITFVVILLLVVMRPLFMGQVQGASMPYTITYQNGTSTSTSTITPDATISVAQANTIYSVVIFLVALIGLIVILLSVAGKI